jgi:signal transduction histidine kinase
MAYVENPRDTRKEAVMMNPENGLSRMEHDPEQARLHALSELGLLETESVPMFEESTQTAAHFLDVSICVLGVLDRDRLWYKSAIGLSRLGLMNSLASSRQLDRHAAFCTQVVETQQVLAIADAANHPVYSTTDLVQRYGIRAYLGVPLITSEGICVGTLAVMEQAPRSFTSKEIDTLQMMARWSMSEFERERLLKQGKRTPATVPVDAPISVKSSLIAQMTQELCTPLTSILGMGSVLSQGIYGTLTDKQREYIEIIHNSGQYLLSLVNEIVELGSLDDSDRALNLTPVDVEMLCQQAISTLNQAAQRREQQMQLTVEPGPRIWLLDKDKVRQLLYHLVFGVIQTSNAGGTIRIHVSRKQSDLNLTVWISHPWLGDGLPADYAPRAKNRLATVGAAPEFNEFDEFEFNEFSPAALTTASTWDDDLPDDYASYSNTYDQPEELEEPKPESSRQGLGLLLSTQLAELHGGNITVKGSAEEGFRYVVRLPYLRSQAGS